MKKLLLVAVLMGMGPVLDAMEVNEVLFHLEQTEQGIKSLRFDFSQKIQFSESDMASQVKGKAVFTSNNKWWIERLNPNKQITISNGQKMWVYTPDYNQVWEGRWKSWIKSDVIPKGLIPLNNYVAELRQNFDPSIKSETEDGKLILTLSPKDASAGYSLEMAISTESWLPVQTTFKSDAAVVTTKLENMEVNPAVGDSLFQFKAPQGVDVISVN